MNCKYCNKEINNKGGLVKHENGCKFNPNKIVYKNNFIEYNQKVKEGVVTKNKNQYQLAKDKGEVLLQSEETKKKISNKKLGSIVSVETKSKLSEARSKILEELGKGGFKHIKWYKIKNIEGEAFIVRGTWELFIANTLNEYKIKWVRKIYLKYTDEKGVKRTYTPDFYLPELKKYIEVKGYFSDKDKEKLKRVLKENNITLLLIKDIKDNNLIKNINSQVSPLSYTQ